MNDRIQNVQNVLRNDKKQYNLLQGLSATYIRHTSNRQSSLERGQKILNFDTSWGFLSILDQKVTELFVNGC